MQFTWNDIVNRARVYLDDDHDDNGGWIDPANWLTLGNVEYAALYKRWCRMGLISPPTADAAFATHTTTVSSVLATVGLAEDFGDGRMRVILPAQSMFGRSPFWGHTRGMPQYWSATGAADNITYTLEPRRDGNYLVRYLPRPDYATALTETVDLPYGGDERLVLGVAKRAGLKESAASRLLQNLIDEADAELNFSSFGRANGDSPRVRSTPRENRRNAQLPSDPRRWIYH